MKVTTRKIVLDIIFAIMAAGFVLAAYAAYKADATGIAIAFGVGSLLLVLVATITHKKSPKREDYEYLENYCTQNQYEKMDFNVLEPEIREHSHYMYIKGKFSTLYSNPAMRPQFIVTITQDTGPNTYGVLPAYTLLITRGKQYYAEHCLAFPSKSRENNAFEMIYGEKYNSLDLHPTLQFYSTESSLAEETVQTVAGIIEHLGSPKIYIECIGSWLIVALHRTPARKNAEDIFEFIRGSRF